MVQTTRKKSRPGTRREGSQSIAPENSSLAPEPRSTRLASRVPHGRTSRISFPSCFRDIGLGQSPFPQVRTRHIQREINLRGFFDPLILHDVRGNPGHSRVNGLSIMKKMGCMYVRIINEWNQDREATPNMQGIFLKGFE